jgi:P27 family predicted phage terminase small subunit
MPEDIPETAQWKWMETVELMRQMGTLSIAYADWLRMYAEAWGVYLEASARVRKLGTAFVTVDPQTKKVTTKPNPFERVMRQSRQDLVRMEAELGLTPAAKSRLVIPKTQGVAVRKRHG